MSKTTDALHTLINEAILKRSNSKAPRDYMGTSGLGEPCDRALWYSYHTPKPVNKPNVLRKFDFGHTIEPLAIQWLKDAGLQLWNTDKNGEQFGFVDGVIAGHVDGIVRGMPFDENTPYLLEIKTANNFYFKEFVNNGIGCNEKYKTQVHIYMHKMKLKKCLFMVVNKNGDTVKENGEERDIYFEVIELDEFFAISSLARGFEIAEMSEMPGRKYHTKSFFKCQYCNYKPECWSKE